MKERIAFTTILIASFAVVISCAKPPAKLPEPTAAQKEGAAEVKYTGELVDCVKRFTTVPLQNSCADDVRAKWSKDGGK